MPQCYCDTCTGHGERLGDSSEGRMTHVERLGRDEWRRYPSADIAAANPADADDHACPPTSFTAPAKSAFLIALTRLLDRLEWDGSDHP